MSGSANRATMLALWLSCVLATEPTGCPSDTFDCSVLAGEPIGDDKSPPPPPPVHTPPSLRTPAAQSRPTPSPPRTLR